MAADLGRDGATFSSFLSESLKDMGVLEQHVHMT